MQICSHLFRNYIIDGEFLFNRIFSVASLNWNETQWKVLVYMESIHGIYFPCYFTILKSPVKILCTRLIKSAYMWKMRAHSNTPVPHGHTLLFPSFSYSLSVLHDFFILYNIICSKMWLVLGIFLFVWGIITHKVCIIVETFI